MALKPLFGHREPVGVWDGLDSELTSFKGGEIVTLTGVTYAGSDKASADVSDGYTGTVTKTRPAVTLTLASGNRPLFVSDDGTGPYYGTLFGTVVGGTTGQIVTGGAVLGPHTATGSGKITCWRLNGTYAVTLDACDTTASTGLVTSNASLAVGSPLYATTAGKLTPNSVSSFEASLVVGRFLEFSTGGSLVTSPVHLVSAINSPTSDIAGAQPRAFIEAIVDLQLED